MSCDREVSLRLEVENLPAGATGIVSAAFPGGSCTPIPAAPYDPAISCDLGLPQAAQGCGADGVCVTVEVGSEAVAACRPACDPSQRDACGRFGYVCDFDVKACVEGCQSDEECRLELLDTNDDGDPDVIAYDADSDAICDPVSFRCVHEGAQAVDTGAPCGRLDECAADGLCVQPLQTFAGLPFPDGYCTKLGCDVSGRECDGDGAVCTRIRAWSSNLLAPPACFLGCEVGVEPEADRVGSSGHGVGCREGYRCHYNGTGTDGVCVGGNYNAIVDNNVGAPCTLDSECYSPFGLGSCLELGVGAVQPGGSCAIVDCNAPGMPEDVCGKPNQCIGLNGDLTFCAKTCTKASECAPEYACADDDLDPSTPRICYPSCAADEDCRDGESCSLVDPEAMIGECVASGR